MDNEILISIIVPVYNVEKYLEKCLLSLLQATGFETEIILVLGDSQDRSNEIGCFFSKQYKNIFTIQQDGKGLSNARNCGFQIARGIFINFIDSDDFILVENYKKLIDFLKNNIDLQFDAMLTDYIRVFENGKLLEYVDTLNGYTVPTIVNDLEVKIFFEKRNCFWNVWRYVYRKEFLVNNQIYFLEDHTTEDVDYTARVFLFQHKLIFWHNPFYFYRTGRTSSLVNTTTPNRVQDVEFILEKSISLFEKSNRLYADEIIEQFRLEYLLNLVLLIHLPTKSTKSYFLNWKTIIGNSSNKYLRLGAWFIQIAGLKGVARCLYCLKIFRRYKKSAEANWERLKDGKCEKILK